MSQSVDSGKTFEDFDKLIRSDSVLPKSLNEILLRRYFKVCAGDCAKAIELFKLNLKLREQGPQIFSNRDVLSSSIQISSKIVQICPLPKLTDDSKRVLLIRYTTSDTSQYSCVDVIKMLLMMIDVRYAVPDEDNKLADADILVLDLKGYNFKHFLNNVKHAKTVYLYFKYIQESVPVATTAAHILNSSWVVDKLMAMIRPMLKKEVADSFRFHSQGLDSLHKFVAKEVLPSEYGGSAGSMDSLHLKWMEIFENQREYLIEDSNWRISE